MNYVSTLRQTCGLSIFQIKLVAIKILFAALVLGFFGTAQARQTTFAWNADPAWPTGTTVELDANGTSANGITENRYTLDVNVLPGEIIHAKVRAIPPEGYQCGDPIGTCPPSIWTEIAQTFPEAPSGIWATKEIISGGDMSLSQVGSGDYDDNGGSTGLTRSVSKDTGTAVGDIALILASWYEGNRNVTTLPSGFTAATSKIDNNSSSVQVFYRVIDGTEPTTWSMTFSSVVYANMILLTLRGDSALAFVSATASAYQSGTTATAPSVTGTSGYGLIAAFGNSDPTTMTTPGGMAAGTVGGQTTNTGRFFFETLSASGSTGTRVSTLGTSRDTVPISILVSGATSGSTTNTSTTSLNALVQKTGITSTSSLSALLQKSFSGTVSLDSLIAAVKSGAVSIDALLQATDKSATVSVDGLVQAVKTGVVSIDAAIAIIIAVTSGVDALLQSSFNATTGLDAIVSGGSSVSASLDGLLQSGKSTTASLDALLQAGAVSTASIDALLQKSAASTVSLDAFIQGSASAIAALDALLQGARTGTLSLDAIIVSAGQALATTSLDGLVQAVKTGLLSLDAMIAVPVAGATAGLDALLSVTGVSTVSLDALLQAAKTGILSIDGLIQSAKTAQVSIDGLVQSAKTGTTSLDAVVGVIGSAAISLDGILQKSRASGVFLDAIIGLISSIIMPTGRVISIAPTDRFIVISETDRFIVIPNSDRSILN